MAITTKITVTTRQTRTITLTEEEICSILREHFNISFVTEVDFDIRQGSYLAGCTITEITETTKEEPNGEG